MKLSLLIIIFCSFNLFAQDRDSIFTIFNISDENGQKIKGIVTIIEQGSSSFEIVSDEAGVASCMVERFGELKATFTHPAYSKLTIIEEIHNNTSLDTVHYRITLTSIKSLQLSEITVIAPGVPEVVFSSVYKSVQDYEILNEQEAVLLTYPKRLKKGSQLLLYDMAGTVKDSVEIHEEAIELTSDYEGHIYLIHTRGCKRIIIQENSIQAVSVSYYYYHRYIEPIIGTSDRKMYFSTYDELYPAFDYYTFDVIDSSYTKFASVIDSEMMEQYRAEYRFADMHNPIDVRKKLAAKNLELATGIDAEIYYGRQNFTRSIYYEPPFAPMFQVNEQLYLFDYQCDSLKTFDEEGLMLSEVAITHDHNDRRNGWQKVLLQDRIKNRVYVLYEKGGFYYLNNVDLLTGELGNPIKLNHRYAEEIQVYNGYIYYIYRPFESYQKKYFWREKLL